MKKGKKTFRFYHIHIVSFLRSLGVGAFIVALLIFLFWGGARTLAHVKQERTEGPLRTFLPIDDTRLLKETFCFFGDPYPLSSFLQSWQPVFSILSEGFPSFSSHADEILLLQTSGSQVGSSLTFPGQDLPAEPPPPPPAPEEGEPIPPGALPIQSITISPQEAQGYLSADNIYLNNQTSYKINLNEFLAAPLPFRYQSGKVQVLIVHTHGTESYSPEGAAYYTEADTNRSLDNEENVLKIGEEVARRLSDAGIGVIHNTTIHDHPSFNGSYANAEKTIVAELKAHPSICIVLDIHRDAMITAEGVKYRPVIRYDDKDYAQVMLVMGTDEGGLTHKNWRQNLSFAVKVQKGLNDKIPALARPLYLKKERFNQHATPGSLLIEVGASGNYQSDALNTVEPLSQVLIDIIKGAS